MEAAVTGARPDDVMPATDGTPGWSAERRDAFRAFSRSLMSTMYLIVTRAQVVGMVRMAPTDDPEVVETGIWLCRQVRGRGLGEEALGALLRRAATAGARTVVAETTEANAPAVAALLRCGAVLEGEGHRVRAAVTVGATGPHARPGGPPPRLPD